MSSNPKRRPYPAEFRREAVELYHRSGKSITSLAAELGVAHESLRQWIRQADVDVGARDGLTSAEQAELRELRAKVKRLEAERDLLKRAAAFFAKEIETR